MVKRLLLWAVGFLGLAVFLGVVAYQGERAGPTPDQIAYDDAVETLAALETQARTLEEPEDITNGLLRLQSLRSAVDRAEMNLEERRDMERLAPSMGQFRLERERAEQQLAEAESAVINNERALVQQVEAWRERAPADSVAFVAALSEYGVSSLEEFQNQYIVDPFGGERPDDAWLSRQTDLFTLLSFFAGCVAAGLGALGGIAAFIIGIGRERRALK